MELDSEKALEIIKPFLTKKWSCLQPGDVSITQLKGGFCNTLWLVSRPDDGDKTEPLSLVVRMRGGNMINIDDPMINQDTTNSVVAYEMSRLKMGPRLIGFFPNGRIEEYVKSHTLRPDEAADPAIAKDIAIALARVHCLQGLPIAEKDEFLLQWIKKSLTGIHQKISDAQKIEEIKNQNLDFGLLLNFDYDECLEWLTTLVRKVVKMRMSVVLMDMNHLNCLVKEDLKSEELKVMLIDYDTIQLNFRGFDLGTHFFNRKMQVDNKVNKIASCDFPSEEEKRRFLKIYQQEVKRLNVFKDFDEHGQDSVDHLLLECDVGSALSGFGFTTYCFAMTEVFQKDPPWFKVAEFMLKHIIETRKRLDQILPAVH